MNVFQLPPHDHEKLVYIVRGKVVDVVLDMGKTSKTYRRTIFISLNSKNQEVIFIPKGCDYGFKSMEDDTGMMYKLSTVYSGEADFGMEFDGI